jgi:hypothetical protein
MKSRRDIIPTFCAKHNIPISDPGDKPPIKLFPGAQMSRY